MEPLIGAPRPAAKTPAAADLVIDGSDETFEQDVLLASKDVAVIVDFWAPWCGPCKQLGPVIEKVVREARGAVKLVKINTDEHPYFAQQLRVQSIPAVYAFKGGRPVDAFVGAQPESAVRQFVKRLAAGAAPAGPSPVEQALEQAAAAAAAGDLGTASALYGQILAREPGHAAAVAGLARCHLGLGDGARARKLVDGLPAEAKATAEIQQVLAQIEVLEKARAAEGQIAPLRERLAKDPKDHQARLELAEALFAADPEAAIGELLELFRRDRKWNEEAARKQLVRFFEALGPTHALTVSGRRRLSSLMFS
jgi:putative thioredoxin